MPARSTPRLEHRDGQWGEGARRERGVRRAHAQRKQKAQGEQKAQKAQKAQRDRTGSGAGQGRAASRRRRTISLGALLGVLASLVGCGGRSSAVNADAQQGEGGVADPIGAGSSGVGGDGAPEVDASVGEGEPGSQRDDATDDAADDATDGAADDASTDDSSADDSPGGADDGVGDPSQPPGTLPTDGAALPIVFAADGEAHRYVRLTHAQWENSVRDNLRLGEASGEVFTPDPSLGKYSNDERALFVGQALYFDYERAAEALGARVASEPALLQGLDAGTEPAQFVAELGRRFYRRPLDAGEQARYLEIFETGASLGSPDAAFTNGASLVVEVLLQAPRFLYRIEDAEPSAPLDGYELATKLSLLLTDSTPSDALLTEVAEGALTTAESVRETARTLLESERGRLVLRRFHAETFRTARLAAIEKPAELGWSAVTNQALLHATELYFDRLYEDSLGVRQLLLSDFAFADAELAALYELPPPPSGFAQLTLGASRPGYFTQLPFLSTHAVRETPDPIARGTSLNVDLLCATLPPTEPSGDMSPPMDLSGLTNRQRITTITSAAECVTCHAGYIDPLGFAFESFDGLGRERSTDNGQPVDTSGSYPFSEGERDFVDARELMEILAESEQVHTCYAKQLSEFALGRALGQADVELVEALRLESQDEAASSRELLLSIVSSETFRNRGAAR